MWFDFGIDEYQKRFCSIEGEEVVGGGSGEVDTGGTPPPDTGADVVDDGDKGGIGSGRSTLRKQLEKNFEADNKARAKVEEKDKKAPARARRVAGGAEIDETPEPAATGEPAEGQEVTPPPEVKDSLPVPEALSKEAKAEWAKTPTTVQQAFIKREQDVARGVQELKGRYLDIDKALEPHVEAIRRHGHTPAQAVAQLFGWFQALASNPEQSFPALAKSFNYDLAKIAAAQAAAPGGGKEQPAGEIPQAVQKYIHDLTQKVAGLEQAVTQKISGLEGTFQQQSEAKTQEILTQWSQGKPHFEASRGTMAQLIASGAVPLKNGQVDLDGAYEMACYANPEIRKLVLAEQEGARVKAEKDKKAAEAKLQQEQANKARRAGVNVSGGAPGQAGTIAGRPAKKGKSVRESLAEAMDEIQT